VFPIRVSPAITTFVRVQRENGLFRGVVHVLRGTRPFRHRCVCQTLRATYEEALIDADWDAATLIYRRDEVRFRGW
jgi:hypothetical protein